MSPMEYLMNHYTHAFACCTSAFLTGVEPLIPIYQRGILYGSPTIREVSATGLGELMDYTATTFLSGPLMVKMTGPLLRIVGDRNPPTVKVAILQTLQRILQKGGPALRAFVPQFQTTFVKALSDPSRQVRVEAIRSLTLLMPLSTRVDPLLKELVSGALGKSAAAEGLAAGAAIQTATLEALASVLEHCGGTKLKSMDSVESALDAARQLLTHPDEGIRDGAAKVLGRSCALMDVTTNELQRLMDDDDDATEATVRHGRACAIRRLLEHVPAGGQLDPALMEPLKRICTSLIKDEKSLVREAGFAALGATLGRSATKSSWKACEGDWLSVLRDSKESLEIHRAVARGLGVALTLMDPTRRIGILGINILDACLTMALKSSQRVQLAFYDVLYLALNVAEEGGDSGGLNRYCELANFDNQRAMKSLHAKVLLRIKAVSILEH